MYTYMLIWPIFNVYLSCGKKTKHYCIISARVDIVEPALSHAMLEVGTPLHLTCTASNSTQIGWLKGDEPIRNGLQGYVISEDVESEVKTSLLSRDGAVNEDITYTCYNKKDVSDRDEIRVSFRGMLTEILL